MISKQLADITFADIAALIANAVPEGRTIEYKAKLPGPNDANKREFLADVTSFANTDGGDLLFGIEAPNGVAAALPGTALTDTLDATLLRLESLLASCVEPRLIGAKPKAFELTDGNVVIMWRIPASFAAPHRANHGDVRRFFHRNSRGKAEMDVHELRAAFTASEGFVPRLTALHLEAVRQVADGDLPFKMAEGPRAVLSIIPLSVLRERREIDLNHENAVWPVAQNQGIRWVQALEGFYVFGISESEGAASYALTHRTGQVDVVWRVRRQDQNGEKLIWPPIFENNINAALNSAATKLGAFSIEGPFAIGLTLTGVEGDRLALDYFSRGAPAWRSRFSLPMIVTVDLQPESILPLARNFWLSMGETRPDRPLGKTDT